MYIKELTEILWRQCEEAEARFLQMREEQLEPDFFKQVKPHADQLRQQLLLWQQFAIEWCEQVKPKYIYKIQIQQVVEAMEQLIVQSYYKETSKKRFLQALHSIQYTLSTLLRAGEGK